LDLYLDDCAFSHELKRLLQEAGHHVTVPADAQPPLSGADDAIHFAHARATARVILTLNLRDFKDLHDREPEHPGILAVYQDNDPTKDMSYRQVVQAVANLERTGVAIAGGFWVLNAYRYPRE
jgi:predicted nuclease of predicted toxin-antitoxin system